jgi:hypothetical protein
VALEIWLHGWPRLGRSVLLGSAARCVGCGRDQGIVCVALPTGWEPPGPEPEWPFALGDCPVCDHDEGTPPTKPIW